MEELLDLNIQLAFLAGAFFSWMCPTCTALAIASYLFILGLRQYFRGPTKGTDNKKRLDGKTVVITGSNTGIGKVTAHELSKRGARVIMCCRNLEKANSAAREIMTDTKGQVEVRKLDLSSLESVRECAKDLNETEQQIDYLINVF